MAITQKRLKEIVEYSQKTGEFKWRIRNKCSPKFVGDGAGWTNEYSYLYLDGETYPAHRAAWLYVYGYMPENEIDHINRNKSDNRINNLREVSHLCNMRNKGIYKNNKSGVTGVNWHQQSQKWVASIRVEKKLIYLGIYETVLSAAKARWLAEVKYKFPNCNTTSSALEYIKKHGDDNDF